AMSEVALTPETISRFRRSYIEAFGAPSRDDALYAAVSEGRRFAGMEHWLPFFYERLETVFDYLPDAPIVFDHLAHEALAERHTLILDHYEARRKQADSALKDAVPYKPVAPDLLYLSPDNLKASLGPREDIDFTVFD
ncbi:MAG: transcription-repair coupling factor, partial [Mesorhizobium sp.]